MGRNQNRRERRRFSALECGYKPSLSNPVRWPPSLTRPNAKCLSWGFGMEPSINIPVFPSGSIWHYCERAILQPRDSREVSLCIGACIFVGTSVMGNLVGAYASGPGLSQSNLLGLERRRSRAGSKTSSRVRGEKSRLVHSIEWATPVTFVEAAVLGGLPPTVPPSPLFP